MKLSPEQTEQVRLCILRYCLAPSPISEGLILSYLRAEGFSGLEREQLAMELHYLHGKGLIETAARAVSPENKRWQASAAGMDYLASQNLA